MKIDDLMDMTLREILDKFVSIQSLECGYYYGITTLEDLNKIDEEYKLKEYVEEYGESFYVENLINDELLIDGGEPVIDYDKLVRIMHNLGISKKEEGTAGES